MRRRVSSPSSAFSLGFALLVCLTTAVGCPDTGTGTEPEPTPDGGNEDRDAGTEPEPTVDAGHDAGALDAGHDAGPAPFCPARIKFTALAEGISHVGWTGITHNVGPAEGANFTADVVQCDDECRNCRFEGPTFDGGVNLLRCENDSSIPCDETTVCPSYSCLPLSPQSNLCSNNFMPCTEDSQCDPSQCKVFWGGNSGSNTSVSGFGLVFGATDGAPPVQGRIDLLTGQVTFDRLGIQVTSSSQAAPGFPPVCVGDDVRNDGVKNGTCEQNPWNDDPTIPSPEVGFTRPTFLGETCDAHSGSPVPSRAGIYSLDCAVPLSSTLGFDLSTRGNSTAVQAVWTLDVDDQPACADGPCWCGVCADTAAPCHSQSDCAGSACVGTPPPPGVDARANRCADACAWDEETFRGTCNTLVGFEPDGGPPILGPTPCLPAGEGAELRVTGSSTRLNDRSYSIQTGALGCAAIAGVPATNTAIGLPGPNVGLYRFRVDLE